jgi:hypothetical protein
LKQNKDSNNKDFKKLHPFCKQIRKKLHLKNDNPKYSLAVYKRLVLDNLNIKAVKYNVTNNPLELEH